MNAREFVKRLRAVRWGDRPQRPPAPPPGEEPAAVLARLLELLRTLAVSDRSIRAWDSVSQESKDVALAANAETRAIVQARIQELGGGSEEGSTAEVHPLP